MSKFKILIMVSILNSCGFKIDPPVNLYLKKIKTPNISVEWFYHSLLTSTPPDRILVKSTNGETIGFQFDNVSDVNVFSPDSIVISFCGHPKVYGKQVKLPPNLKEFNMKFDTLANCKLVPKFRKTFVD